MARSEILTKARTSIEVDGKSADEVLSDLKAKADQYTRAMVEAQKANDKVGFDKAKKSANEYNTAVRTIEKSTADVNAVMKNLSGATMKDLLGAKRKITEQLKGMARGTDEYTQKTRQLQQVNNELGKIRSEMGGVAGANQGMIGKMRSGFMWMAGAVGAVVGLWRGLMGVINSTKTSADNLAAAKAGIKAQTDVLAKSIASLDFSGLGRRMAEARKAAIAYARGLAEIGDEYRSLSLEESAYADRLAELEVIMRSEKGTTKDRQAALEEYRSLALKFAKENERIAENESKVTAEAVAKLIDLDGEKLIELINNYNQDRNLREKALEYQKAYQDESVKSAEAFMKSTQKIVGSGMNAQVITVMKWTDEGKQKHQEYLESFRSTYVEQNESLKGYTREQLDVYLDYLAKYSSAKDAELDKAADAQKKLNTARARYNNENKKLVRLENTILNTAQRDKEEFAKKEIAALEALRQETLLAIHQNYLDRSISKKQFDEQIEALEQAHLEARIGLYKHFGMDTVALEQKRVENQIRVMEEFQAEQFRVSDEIVAKNQVDTEKSLAELADALEKELELERKANEEKRKLTEEEEERQRRAREALVEKMEQYKSVYEGMAVSMGNLLGRAATDAEMTAKEVAKEMLVIAIDSLHGLVQIALGQIWIKATAGGPAAMIAAIAKTAAVEAIFAGVKAAVMNVGQRFGGKYDVIGEDDGRTYRNVPYQGVMKTRIYDKPTLVAERGPELIVDAGTLRNVSVNFPDVLPKIRASMVPQRATGNVAERIATPAANSEMTAILANNNKALNANNALMATLNQQLGRGISANIQYAKIEEANNKVQKIRKDVTRS
jgi:hypothetical protein